MQPPPALLSFWAQGQGQCPPVLTVRRGWVIGSSQRSMKVNRSDICHFGLTPQLFVQDSSALPLL